MIALSIIRRSTDAAEVDGLLERIGGADAILGDYPGRWHAWVWDGGAFVIIPLSEDESEVHVYVLPEFRGLRAVRAAREVALAENESGVTLIGKTPLQNIPARRFANLCGGVVVGVEDGDEVRLWAR